ncbi:hypothetical protein ACJX0J_037769 [Zea mays]
MSTVVFFGSRNAESIVMNIAMGDTSNKLMGHFASLKLHAKTPTSVFLMCPWQEKNFPLVEANLAGAHKIHNFNYFYWKHTVFARLLAPVHFGKTIVAQNLSHIN